MEFAPAVIECNARNINAVLLKTSFHEDKILPLLRGLDEDFECIPSNGFGLILRSENAFKHPTKVKQILEAYVKKTVLSEIKTYFPGIQLKLSGSKKKKHIIEKEGTYLIFDDFKLTTSKPPEVIMEISIIKININKELKIKFTSIR